jgi:glycosyltransferase involved in cell wall biosynthesis
LPGVIHQTAGKRVLFLAYHFPPIGGGGVQRNAKFVRYLPDHGYAPVVVTGPGDSGGYWTPSDETLLEEVPAPTEVHRLAGPEPLADGDSFARLRRWVGQADAFAKWWVDGAVDCGRRLRGIELVYGSLAPYDSAEAAAKLASLLGRPWVADLQDPWALDELWLYPTGIHRRRDLRRMAKLLGSAAAIVMNSEGAAERLLDAFPELRNRSVVTIPNGFDDSDFDGPADARDDTAFRIVHTGYLYTAGRRSRSVDLARRLLGGSVARVDFRARSHAYLLEAAARLAQARPNLRIEIHLAGVMSTEDLAVTSPLVRVHGYLAHAEAIRLMRTADLLFLPLHERIGGGRVAIVPGKTYEYLAAGRPILAAVPEGDARDLLRGFANTELCEPADVTELTSALARAVDRWERSDVPAPPPREALAPFKRKVLTRRLADVFDDVLAT